jgi:23S rRNA (adenine1618-N6)-methyltransferase
MVTPGGEVAFITRMIDESLAHKENCQWFTSMVGKLSSLTPLIEKLRGGGVRNYAVTEFVQGSKTRRWALGWSFGVMRPVGRVCRGTNAVAKGLLPFGTEVVHDVSLAMTYCALCADLSSRCRVKTMWKSM